ncbi:hypothetical protein FACS1894111_13330 [Clostridia bacterium]|nr:hypothetical protein FACS1894111_13330 [Clostridia bacterium]
MGRGLFVSTKTRGITILFIMIAFWFLPFFVKAEVNEKSVSFNNKDRSSATSSQDKPNFGDSDKQDLTTATSLLL